LNVRILFEMPIMKGSLIYDSPIATRNSIFFTPVVIFAPAHIYRRSKRCMILGAG
jgi:hypothetical protein